VDGMRRQMEKTAIELLKEAIRPLRTFQNNLTQELDPVLGKECYRQNPELKKEDTEYLEKVHEIISSIDAYLSSPPSERAKELVEDIRRTDADDAWHLTFNDAAHEIEEYVYAKNEELTKIMDEYEDKIAEMEKALNDISRCPPCRKRKEKRMEKTFEQFLTENVEKGFIDFRIHAEMQDKYTVRFYIHVLGHDSDTLYFTVDENILTQVF
jgi:replicative DNA helicase